MAFSVRKLKMRATNVCDKAGALSEALAPLSDAGLNMESVVGYVREKGGECSIYCSLADTGKKAGAAADAAGVKVDANSPALLIEGDDKPGIMQKIAQVAGDAGISMRVCVGLTMGKRFSILLGFDDAGAADAAAKKIRPLGAKKPAKKKGK